MAARLAADHAYIDALRRGEEPADARLSQDWLSGPHRSTWSRPEGGRSSDGLWSRGVDLVSQVEGLRKQGSRAEVAARLFE